MASPARQGGLPARVRVDRPIFVIGCPRSGTTVFQDVLAAHEDFGWVSDAVERRPDRPFRAVTNLPYFVPFLGEQLYLRRHSLPKAPVAVEPWNFFERALPGFKSPTFGPDARTPWRHTSEDMTDEQAEAIRRAVAENLRYQGRRRFLSKYTDYPRIAYMRKAFPDARFVHLLRDGRAVAHSYAKKMKSGSFGTWDERRHWVAALPSNLREQWDLVEQTPLTLALVLWKYYVTEIRADAANLPSEQYLEVRYRELIDDRAAMLAKVAEFAEVDRSRRFDRILAQMPLSDMNRKWRTELSTDERRLLDSMVTEPEFRALLDLDD